MTEQQQDSVGAVLALDPAEQKRLRERIEQVSTALELGAKLGRVIPGGGSAAIAGQIAEELHRLLETPISRILAEAWSRDPALGEVAARGRPSDTALVPLADHAVASTFKPAVELLLEEALLGQVDFEVHVEAKLTGAVVGVRAGRIMELRAGTTKAAVKLSCGGTEIASRERDIKLPGVIRFEEGIPLAAAAIERRAAVQPIVAVPTGPVVEPPI